MPFKIGATYQGAQDEAEGIVGMLDVMKSDFERTITETKKEEAQAEKDHLDFMTETGKSLAEAETSQTARTEQKSAANGGFDEASDNLDSQTATLQQALTELLELKPACVETAMSYDERVANREEEIQALTKALCILSANSADNC